MISLKKSVVVFDVDGTMLSSFPLLVHCIADVLRKYPNKITKPEDIASYYGPDEKGMFRKLLNDPGLADRAFADYLKEYAALHQQFIPRPIDGIGELLRELRNRRTLRLGIVTGRSQESLDISLNALNLGRFFENIQTGSAKGVNKPESMRKLIAAFGVSRSEVIYVGDTAGDVRSMRAVGVPLVSVWYDHPENKDELLELNPGMAVGSVAELRELLLKYIR